MCVSDPLPILVFNSMENKDFHLPDIGEDVLCFFGSAGMEDGYIIGSIYAGEIEPPNSSTDVRMVKFSDGSYFKFDRSGSIFECSIGTTKIELQKNQVSIETSQLVSIKSAANVKIEGSAQVSIESPILQLTVGGTTMQLTGSNATIASQDLTFTGNVSVTGNLDVSGTGTFLGPVTAPDFNS